MHSLLYTADNSWRMSERGQNFGRRELDDKQDSSLEFVWNIVAILRCTILSLLLSKGYLYTDVIDLGADR